MNKKELIRTISQELTPSMSQDKIALVLDKAVEITKRTRATGEPVKWSGFGSFIMKTFLHDSFIPHVWRNTPHPKVQNESHSSRQEQNSRYFNAT